MSERRKSFARDKKKQILKRGSPKKRELPSQTTTTPILPKFQTEKKITFVEDSDYEDILESVLGLFISDPEDRKSMATRIQISHSPIYSPPTVPLVMLDQIIKLCQNKILYIQKLIHIQSVIRMWNIRIRLPLLLPKTSEHWTSLITSESQYIRQLECVSKHYFSNILRRIDHISILNDKESGASREAPREKELLPFISHAQIILDVSNVLLERLNILNQNYPILFGIGNVFLRLEQDFAAYEEYLIGIYGFNNLLGRIKSQNPNLSHFLGQVQGSSPYSQLSLGDLLLLPAIQISKYESCLSGMALDLFHSIHQLSAFKRRTSRGKEEKKNLLLGNQFVSLCMLPSDIIVWPATNDEPISSPPGTLAITAGGETSVPAEIPTKSPLIPRTNTQDYVSSSRSASIPIKDRRRSLSSKVGKVQRKPRLELRHQQKKIKSMESEDFNARIGPIDDILKLQKKEDQGGEITRLSHSYNCIEDHKIDRNSSNLKKKKDEKITPGGHRNTISYHDLKRNTNPILWSELKSLWLAYRQINYRHKVLRSIIAGKIALDSFKEPLELEYKDILQEGINCPLLHEGDVFYKKKTMAHLFLFSNFILITKGRSMNLWHVFLRKNLQIEVEKKEKDKGRDVAFKFVVSNPPNQKEIEVSCDTSFFETISKWLNNTKVFGIELSSLAKLPSSVNGIPAMVIHTTNWIRDYGITEGIFRKSGSTKEIEHYKHCYDEGLIEFVNQIDPSVEPNTIAGLLKLFFRQLPTPLIPPTHYQKFLDINTDGYCLDSITSLLKTLPRVHYSVLGYLCKFLNDISKFSAITLMDVSNLSIVIGTNIIRPKTDTPQDSMKWTQVTNLMEIFIQNSIELFPSTDKEEPDWYKTLIEYEKNNRQVRINDQTPISSSSSPKTPFGVSKKESAIDLLNMLNQEQIIANTPPIRPGSPLRISPRQDSIRKSQISLSPRRDPPPLSPKKRE